MSENPDNPPLRVAVPNKGALSAAASEILREAGYRQRSDSKELALTDPENNVEFFYLRPRDIALYVGEGTLDVGITGRDLLLDSGAKADEALRLGFGRSNFHFAGPAGQYTSLDDLAGKRIATSYDGVVRSFLEEQGHRGERDPARRCGGDQHPARRGRRHRRRRGDGLDAAGRRPGHVRRRRSCARRRSSITRGGTSRPASRSSGAGSRASSSPAAT